MEVMTVFDETQHPRSDAGKFREKRTSAPTANLASPLASMSPSDIDVKLDALYMKYVAVTERIGRNQQMIERGRMLPYLIEQAKEQNAALTEQRAGLQAQILPYNDEYNRRPWSRAYYVNTPGGHVHKTPRCSTCRPTTVFTWLTDYSGKNEEEIVDAAGETACTVCYPDAPVDVLRKPRSFRIADDAEREERDAKKAAAAATKAAKAITAPDGEQLRLTGTWGEHIKTEASAKTELNRAYELLYEDVAHYPVPNRDFVEEKREDARRLVAALAHKQQRAAGEVHAEHWAKTAKKIDKLYRDDHDHERTDTSPGQARQRTMGEVLDPS